MKFRINIFGYVLISILALLLSFAFQSCEDQPYKYKIASGTPTIYYARLSRVSSRDSLITGAYMGQYVTFVGKNLRSITKMYFNDQEATLNSSFITSNTLIVEVPTTLSSNPTDSIYMVNNDGDTTAYAFKVLVPDPVVSALSNEYAADGDTVTLTGDYLLNYTSSPLKITMAGNVSVTNFISYSKTAVKFVVPTGSQKGYLTVTSKYGKSQSTFYFRDDRYVLFDWDGNGKALASGHGWRNGKTTTSIDGVKSLDGNFLYFKGSLDAGIGATWDEDDFSFDYWPDPTNGYPDLSTLFDASTPSNLDLKFEVNVPNVWDAAALQIIFTGDSEVTYSTANNNYISNTSYPRALWTPWYGTTSGYTTSGWTTVTIPLSDFKYGPDGSTLSALTAGHFTGLTFFVYKGAYAGTACTPTICIDNIRIAPIE